jgi:hypothetical protein
MTMNATSTLIAIANGSLPNEQLAALHFEPQHHQLTLQTAKAIVSSADIFEQALQESGRPYDPNLAVQVAIASHIAARGIYAKEQAEQRGYIYDSIQKGIDRKISQEQHEETIACIKEEPGWLGQVRDAHDRCLGTISTAIARGTVLVILLKLCPFLYVVWNQGASFTVVVGEIMRTVSLELEC